MDYTVGELARLSGLTVRTLHHYESLGLLSPSGRTESGYRQYGDRDVETLHRIVAYQQMGLALKDIGPMLGPDAPPLAEVLDRQVAQAEAQLERQQRLLEMLKRVQKRAHEDDAGLGDHLLKLMSLMRLYERHFSREEIDTMREMQQSLGPEKLERIRVEVDTLISGYRAALARGASVDDAEIVGLTRRWIALEDEMPQAAPLRDKGRAALEQEPALQREMGVTKALMVFIETAVAALKAEGAR